MVFRGNGGGIGRRAAEQKGGGGDYGKLTEESQYTTEPQEGKMIP